MAGGNNGRCIDGRFELMERLGSGGMGTVWRARDLVLQREVALKEVRPQDPLATPEGSAASLRLRERVLREAQALARITHPAVVTIHHIIDHDPHPWLVMELVTGANLQDRLGQGPLAPREAARTGREVLSALRSAHAAGIHHRDVKPANILFRADGSAVLTDFGIAALQGSTSLTATGELVGSPEYIAPERIRDVPDHPAADLWSLGMTLYVAVEGHIPMRRGTALATLAAVLDDPVPPPVRSGPLGPVLSALLVKDPAARPDAAQLETMLEQAAHGITVPPPPPPVPPAPPQPRTAPPRPHVAPRPDSGFRDEAGAPRSPDRDNTPPPSAPHHSSPGQLPPDVAPSPPTGAVVPPPPRAERGRTGQLTRTVTVVVGVLVLLGGIVSGAWWVTQRGGDGAQSKVGESQSPAPAKTSTSPEEEPPPGRSDLTLPTESAVPSQEDSTTPTASPTKDDDPDPAPDASTPTGEAPGGWIAQLHSEPTSSGTSVRDRQLTSIRSSVPGAQVLRSNDYASLRPGYWVIYAPGPFADGKAAVSFCAKHGRTSSNTCVGRYLSESTSDRSYVCHPQGGGSGRCARS